MISERRNEEERKRRGIGRKGLRRLGKIRNKKKADEELERI